MSVQMEKEVLMATVSFDRPVTINPDWGVKNLEYAIEHPINLKERAKKVEPIQRATPEDIKRFVEKNSK